MYFIQDLVTTQTIDLPLTFFVKKKIDELLPDLLLFSFEGRVEGVRHLLEDPMSNLEVVTPNKNTAIILAAKKGFTPIVKMLCKAGVNVDHQSESGTTALMWASENGHHDCVEILLSFRAKIDLQDQNGETALMLAAYQNHLPCVKTLLFHGASKKLMSYNGQNAFDFANVNSECESLLK